MDNYTVLSNVSVPAGYQNPPIYENQDNTQTIVTSLAITPVDLGYLRIMVVPNIGTGNPYYWDPSNNIVFESPLKDVTTHIYELGIVLSNNDRVFVDASGNCLVKMFGVII